MHVINAFEIGDRVFLKPQLDPAVYPEIRRYYNSAEHRIEAPPEEFEAIRSILESHSYTPVLVDDVTEYCVAVPRETRSRTRRFLRELFATHMYDPIPAENRYEHRDWREEHCESEEKPDTVYEREVGSWIVRVMKDRSAVERAIANGARPLSETDLDLSQDGFSLVSHEA